MEDGMIKRKSRYDVIDFLSDKEWKIADLGSGTRGSFLSPVI
jgi:hypothetical protein